MQFFSWTIHIHIKAKETDILEKKLIMKNKKNQHEAVNTYINLIHYAIFYILETCAIAWPWLEDTFLNIPLDPWRSQWSSGRRRILTEGWALRCFQNTVQLVQGACVLQHQ